MDSHTKVVCIKEPITGLIYSRPKVGNTYFMSERWVYNNIEGQSGTDVKREFIGCYIHNTELYITLSVETYNECFITFDQWREQQLNIILNG